MTKSVLLRCGLERAFVLFTEFAGLWWPADRRHTDDATSTIRIEASGRFYEHAADGAEIDLGIVRRFEPPHSISLDWYPGTGPDRPTRVEVRFEAVAGGTRVTVDHSTGAAGGQLFETNAPGYARSWDTVLSALADWVVASLAF